MYSGYLERALKVPPIDAVTMRPKPVPPYYSLSSYPRGSYLWAVDQLAAGNPVRREEWPIEIRDNGWKAIWQVYKTDYSYCKGFSPGCVGADNEGLEGYGIDSNGYSPTPDDKMALDWSLVSETSETTILKLNARPRVKRYPNPAVEYWKKRVAESDRNFYQQLFLGLGILVVGLWIGSYFLP